MDGFYGWRYFRGSKASRTPSPNIFNMNNPPADKVGTARKQAKAAQLSKDYGIPNEGTGRDALRRQQARAILKENPALQMHDFEAPVSTLGGVGYTGATIAGTDDDG